jgi:hypothetical protein
MIHNYTEFHILRNIINRRQVEDFIIQISLSHCANAAASRLRHYVTSRKVVGSIPDKVDFSN